MYSKIFSGATQAPSSRFVGTAQERSEFSMKLTAALSFYGSKIILDRPNHFGWVPIVLDGSNLFWSGPNHFGQTFMDLLKMIWTQRKQIGPFQNDWKSTKMIWLVQNNFGPIEGQGIRALKTLYFYFCKFIKNKKINWNQFCNEFC